MPHPKVRFVLSGEIPPRRSSHLNFTTIFRNPLKKILIVEYDTSSRFLVGVYPEMTYLSYFPQKSQRNASEI